MDRALDLLFEEIKPRNGIIEVRFLGVENRNGDKITMSDAFVQAIEIRPQHGETK